MNEDKITISGIIFEHGQDDFGYWEGFSLTEEEENIISEIFARHDTEGWAVRMMWKILLVPVTLVTYLKEIFFLMILWNV